MFHEFAIDPAALKRWESLRFFADNVGMQRRRLISQYPKYWLTAVWEGCAEETVANRARFQLVLEKLKTHLIKTKRSYEEAASWLENAKRVHGDEPFQAIIACGDAHQPPVLCAESLHGDTPLWAIPPGDKVPRTTAALEYLAKPLLNLSTRIRFIDQHFSSTDSHCRPLAAFLTHAFSGKNPELVEYHLAAKTTTPGSAFKAGLERQLRRLNLPAARKMIFVRWTRIHEGENMHPRYILTNRGGLRIDYGLDEGNAGETTDWNLMSEEHRQTRYDQFNAESTCFKFVDAWELTSSSVRALADWKK